MATENDTTLKPTFFDFVEIGTSDFDTELQKRGASSRGLSIDAIHSYLSRLPDHQNCTKVHAAISNYDGVSTAYFISPETLRHYKLPNWLRGCNSINRPHPTVEKLLLRRSLDSNKIVQNTPVSTYRLQTILNQYRATGVYLLKIDTEGHDTVILKDLFLSATRNLWPYQLRFETNVLGDSTEIQDTLRMLLNIGYDLKAFNTSKGDASSELILNLSRSRKGLGFSDGIEGYYLRGYPHDLDLAKQPMPYLNTIESAQQYCSERGYGGVTYQNGRYEVRKGDYLLKDPSNEVISWVHF